MFLVHDAKGFPASLHVVLPLLCIYLVNVWNGFCPCLRPFVLSMHLFRSVSGLQREAAALGFRQGKRDEREPRELRKGKEFVFFLLANDF